MREPSLVILAAGMGSRFGGMKQITPIGDRGELIIDFSVFDAIRAGFKKIVFIIKEENQADFEQLIGQKIRPYAEVFYVYQSMDDIPQGQSVPQGRSKPWGTGHATLACRSVVHEPFAVINADDYYGQRAFELLYQYLCQAQDDDIAHYAMVGYRLGNTLTENGAVSRGVCEENEEHYLSNITERTKISRKGDIAVFTEGEQEQEQDQELSLDTIVSMNMWAFTPSILKEMEQEFIHFFQDTLPTNPLKAEFYLPAAVNALVKAGKADVRVLHSPDQWYGVTYKEDKDSVAAAMRKMKEDGLYPQELWAK